MSQSRDTSIPFNITLEHVLPLPLPLPPRAYLARTSMKTATDKEGKRSKKEQVEEEEEKAKQVSKEENASSSTPLLEETSTETEETATGTSIKIATDKEGKRIEKEQEEEKGKKVSKEENASSSTPLEETATETEGSDKGNVDILHFNKLTTHDDDDVIPQSKPGKQNMSDSSDRAAINEEVCGFDREIFLFEVQLTRSDIEHERLSIPAGGALKYFPPMETVKPNYEQQIEIYDNEKEDWKMTLTYNHLEQAFVITSGWQGFVDWHELKPMDAIRFYRTFSHLQNPHFLIEFVIGEESKTNYLIHEFKQKNFLFELQLSPSDIGDGVLIVPEEEVRNHFHEINIPAGTNEVERMTFTDTQNVHWCMEILFDGAYMLADGWDGFVKEHKLEAMDMIRFYKPVRPLHEKHFLIECVKREQAACGTNQIWLGGAKHDWEEMAISPN
ncbi:unnamed protein product [Camellia sinensis]